MPQPFSFQPFVQAGGRGLAAALYHQTPGRAGENASAAYRPTTLLGRAGGRLHRPEPPHHGVSTSNRRDTGPISRRTDRPGSRKFDIKTRKISQECLLRAAAV